MKNFIAAVVLVAAAAAQNPLPACTGAVATQVRQDHASRFCTVKDKRFEARWIPPDMVTFIHSPTEEEQLAELEKQGGEAKKAAEKLRKTKTKK